MTYYHPIWAPPSPKSSQRARGRAARGGESAPAPSANSGYIDAIGAFYATPTRSITARARDAYRGAWRRSTSASPTSEAQIFHALALLGTAPASDTRSRAAAGRRDPERGARAPTGASRHRALHDPLVRLSGARRSGATRGAGLREDRARVAPRAAHAVAHLHAARVCGRSRSARTWPRKRRQARSRRRGNPAPFRTTRCTRSTTSSTGTCRPGRSRGEGASTAPRNTSAEPQFPGGYAIAAIPARFALERRDWKEAAALQLPAATRAGSGIRTRWRTTHFARALGAARSATPRAAKRAG